MWLNDFFAVTSVLTNLPFVDFFVISFASNLEHRPEHGNGVIPEPVAPGPLIHNVDGDRFGLGKVSILPLPHFSSQRPVVEQNVVLVIEFKTAAVHVGRTNQPS